MHLVTGYKGEEHIMSADQGSFNASFFGTGQYVMESGSQMEAVIIDNNTVRVYDGDLLMYGRHARIEPNTYEDLTIQTGTAGVNRYDLICATYIKNANDGTEDAYFEVIRGTENERVPDLPEYTDGNILEGATFNQMPLYKVVIEGVVLKEVVPVFSTIPTYQALAERYAAEFQKSCETHIGALNIYDTLEEVEANTQENQLAGALAVKELSQKVNDIDLPASKVNYDNTTSKLSSTTAQGAIDELKGITDGLNSSLNDSLTLQLIYDQGGFIAYKLGKEMKIIVNGVNVARFNEIMDELLAEYPNASEIASVFHIGDNINWTEHVGYYLVNTLQSVSFNMINSYGANSKTAMTTQTNYFVTCSFFYLLEK